MSNQPAPRRRIVVDGSNIATEGRTLPSLAQLDEAIRAFLEEYRGFATSDVTVVVDASFGHRIEPSEQAAFEEALAHGEMITPPAGAVGRGDGFILRIAEKSGALVLSNDSFQEFHAERPWLFDEGRLIGGKPVPGVGWVFTPRTPVRGPKSREVTSRSRRAAKAAAATANGELVEVPGEEGAVEAAKATKAIKATKAAKATAKATKATKAAAKATKATKATKAAAKAAAAPAEVGEAAEPAKKATKAAKTAKATKATKATKAAEATEFAAPAEGGEPTKAAKATKTARAAKAAKATKTAKATKATVPAEGGEPAKAARTTKAAKAAKAAKASKPPNAARSAAEVVAEQAHAAGPGPALNDALTFLTFVAEHPIGGSFEGTVSSFTSHGAHVEVGPMICHVPLRGLADPPPGRARDVVRKGETRTFVLVSLDAAHRRAELALPGVASRR